VEVGDPVRVGKRLPRQAPGGGAAARRAWV
jgi:hypothetical protein